MDVAGIAPGVDFVEAIDRAVGSCDALIVLIGREWVTCTDASGRRRLDDPGDFIRLEVSAALRRNVRVIPALVEGASMPRADSLPQDLQSLARRQAIELSDTRWETDLQRLVDALQGERAPVPPPRPRRRWLPPVVASILAVAIGIGAWLVYRPVPPPPENKTVEKIVVPDLTGLSLLQARQRLAGGFSIGRTINRMTT